MDYNYLNNSQCNRKKKKIKNYSFSTLGARMKES